MISRLLETSPLVIRAAAAAEANNLCNRPVRSRDRAWSHRGNASTHGGEADLLDQAAAESIDQLPSAIEVQARGEAEAHGQAEARGEAEVRGEAEAHG